MLIVRRVIPMGIYGGSTCLQPHARRSYRMSECVTDHTSRKNSRLLDRSSILGVVTTIDAATGEIDHNIRAIDLVLPFAEMRAVPTDDPPRRALQPAAQNDDVVVVGMKCSGEYRPNLARAARNDNPHRPSTS